MQLSGEEVENSKGEYISWEYFSFLRFPNGKMFRLQLKRLQLDDLLTNRKHIIQSESHKKV